MGSQVLLDLFDLVLNFGEYCRVQAVSTLAMSTCSRRFFFMKSGLLTEIYTFSASSKTASAPVPLIRRPGIILFIGIHKYSTLQFQHFYRFAGFNSYSYLFLIPLPNYWRLMKTFV